MRAVDTNVLVRLLARDDEVQLAAARNYVSAGAWVSHLVLAEAVWVLSFSYGAQHKQLVTMLEVLLDDAELSLQEPEVVRAAVERFRAQSKLSFSDCLVLEIARKAGHTPLGTFDRALGKQSGAERL
jgi:predicted nucleic-acid-binding protein